ncbi:MAG: DUF4097 domain-containing protein [Clostridium sp.]|nr:DUF4097 domain-containing protein [Clostridium sp.]MCM1548223.1 DUF4097 domain-containing protein [Ruminococcus sp.]
MNKKVMRYAILTLIFIAGLVIASIGLSMGASEDYKKQLNITDIEAVVPAQDVLSLDIDTDYSDLEIIASNDAEGFEISAENVSRGYLKYSVSNNILRLRYTFNKWYEISSVPFLLKKMGKIKITVPAKIPLKDIQINSGIGTTSVSYLTAENIYIDCGAEESRLGNVNAEYIEINSGSGKISVENITSDGFSFTGGKEDADIKNFRVKNLEMISGRGNISASGSIDGNSFLECGMGDIKAEIFGKKEDYLITVPKGRISVNGVEIMGTKKGKYKMEITKGMGDVDISFK